MTVKDCRAMCEKEMGRAMNNVPMAALGRSMEGKGRRLTRAGVIALVVIAVSGLMQGLRGPVSKAEAARRASVKNDFVYVYAKMNTTSYVVSILRRGERVMISPTRRTAEGRWCSVTELSRKVRLGYVRCEELGRQGGSSPHATEKSSSKRTAKAREPEVKTRKRYTLLVATLVDKGNALSVKKRLEGLGYAPAIHMTTAPVTRHRVSAGEFRSREEAERIARRLNVDGFASDLVEIEGKKYRLEVGWYFSLDEARDLAESLKEKNYSPRIISKAAPTPVHQVRVGGYPNRVQALKALQALKRKGLAPRIVTH